MSDLQTQLRIKYRKRRDEMDQFLERMTRGTEKFPFAYYKEKYSNNGINLHWHPEIEILYGISGKLAVTVAEEKYLLRSGDILFINPEELHSYVADSEEVQYHAAVFKTALFQFQKPHFFEEEFTSPMERGVLKFPRMIKNGDTQATEITAVIDQLFNQHIHSPQMIFADLTVLFCLLLEQGRLQRSEDSETYKKTEDVKRCILYMEEHAARKITLAELAELVHMNPNYFCNYFKKQTGITPFTQLNNIRIRKASEMLRQSRNSVAEIADACGYENANYFIRKFKEMRGCTPSAYRKKECSPS